MSDLTPVAPHYLAGPSSSFHFCSFSTIDAMNTPQYTQPMSAQDKYIAHIIRPFPLLPNELVHYILCVAATRHPEIHSSLRLVASWVRELCQPYMRTAVVIKTPDQAMAFAHFMAYQPRVPFHVNAIWFDHAMFRTMDDAAVVPCILSRCTALTSCALSERAYIAVVQAAGGAHTLDTNRISTLTIHGDDFQACTSYHTHKKYIQEQCAPSYPAFPHVTCIVLNNIYGVRELQLARYPDLTSIAMYMDGPVVHFHQTMARIRIVPNLKHFVIVFHSLTKEIYAKWIKRARTIDKRIFILESSMDPQLQSNNDINGWRHEVMGGEPFWERAMEYTARIGCI